jgi:hypothetical protein
MLLVCTGSAAPLPDVHACMHAVQARAGKHFQVPMRAPAVRVVRAQAASPLADVFALVRPSWGWGVQWAPAGGVEEGEGGTQLP